MSSNDTTGAQPKASPPIDHLSSLFPLYAILQPHQKAFLERILGTPPRNFAYFEQAFIHRSYLDRLPAEVQPHYSNERLEFLGDALLGFIVGEELFWEVPARTEGELTELRARFVNKKALAYCAEQLELHRYLFMGKSAMEQLEHFRATTILADALEALVAAIYLDQGLMKARQFVRQYILQPLQSAAERWQGNYKSMLLEYVQAHYDGAMPQYAVVKTEGPDHDRTYVVQVAVNNTVIGVGQGKSKREAEQQAAYQALHTLGVLSVQDKTGEGKHATGTGLSERG